MALPHAAVATIAGVELRRVRVPLVAPFVAAHGVEHDREVVLVRVVGTDGLAGWGECVALAAPTYSAESTATAFAALRDELVPATLAGRPVDVGARPMAWTAIEVALVDLALRREGRSLVGALGGRPRPLPTCAVVGRQPDVGATVAAVARRVADGHTSVKLKIEPGHDRDHLGAVRSEHPGLELAADANGSYRRGDRDHLVGLATAVGLTLLEQPLPAADLDGSAELAAALAPVGAEVALDESVASVPDLDRAVAAGAGTVLNLKPGRVGGLRASLDLLDRARDAGLGAFVGGMLETGVGRAAALAVASLDACTWPTDLGPSARYFALDLTPPFELLAGARLVAPDGPGIGVDPVPARLDEHTVARAELVP